MIQMPDSLPENVKKDDPFYKHPRVILLEEKHWNYLNLRFIKHHIIGIIL